MGKGVACGDGAGSSCLSSRLASARALAGVGGAVPGQGEGPGLFGEGQRGNPPPAPHGGPVGSASLAGTNPEPSEPPMCRGEAHSLGNGTFSATPDL